MLALHQCNHLLVNLRLGFRRAGQRRIAAKILVRHCFQRHHAKILAHPIAADHRARQLRRLLNVVGCSRRDRPQHNLLRSAATCQRGDLVLQLLLRHDVALILIHLHRVAQSPRRARNDRDLLHRRRVRLQRRNQCMANLVDRHRPFFRVRKDRVLFLVARNDHFNALLQIRLRRKFAPIAHRAQRCLVDNIRQLRTTRTTRHAGDLVEIHVACNLHLARMHLEDFFASLQIRQLHRHPTVKPSRTRQRRVQRFRTVRRRQNDHPAVVLETVHFCEQLVQRLLALIVAAKIARIALLADGVNLVDEDNARRLFLRLLKEIAHLRCTHADEHLDKFRAAHREKRHI